MLDAGLGWHGKCPQPRSVYAPVFCFLKRAHGPRCGAVCVKHSRATKGRYAHVMAPKRSCNGCFLEHEHGRKRTSRNLVT